MRDQPTDPPTDPITAVWHRLRAEAEALCQTEPILAPLLHVTLLDQSTFSDALARLLSERLASGELTSDVLVGLLRGELAPPAVATSIARDLLATTERDPASHGLINPLLNYKGFHALVTYRAAHALWCQQRQHLASILQGRSAAIFAVDIHPAASLGSGIFIDHGTGVVIGETAVVGDDVSMLQNVTLGGTGKECGNRHPKIGRGVLIGAGAKILGNINVGEGAKIGAGSVVLQHVPPHTTVVGIPARETGHPKATEPALSMDQDFDA